MLPLLSRVVVAEGVFAAVELDAATIAVLVNPENPGPVGPVGPVGPAGPVGPVAPLPPEGATHPVVRGP